MSVVLRVMSSPWTRLVLVTMLVLSLQTTLFAEMRPFGTAIQIVGIFVGAIGVMHGVQVGALAGLAGGLQVLAVFHALVSNVSSGIGLLALLVVLLVDARPAWVLPVALTFAAFAISAFKLPLALQVDSSLGGVVQGALVFCALIARALVARST